MSLWKKDLTEEFWISNGKTVFFSSNYLVVCPLNSPFPPSMLFDSCNVFVFSVPYANLVVLEYVK